MSNSNKAYLSLESQLNKFIDKYYKLAALKGFLLTGLFSIGLISIVIFLENIYHFSSMGRSILFFGSLSLLAFAFVKSVLLPFLRFCGVLNRLGYKEAAQLIYKEIPEIKDQLINTIELENKTINSDGGLLDASISQKANKVLKYDLVSAFSVREHKKYLFGFLVILLLAFGFSLKYNSLLVNPFKRVVQFQKSFIPPNPFVFEINNGLPLTVLENDPLLLNIRTIGETDPENIILYSNKQRYFPKKTSKFNFKYDFKTVRQSFFFHLKDGNGDTISYKVKVLPKAKLLTENKIAVYPAYTKLESDTFKDLANTVIPVGTKLFWELKTKNTSKCEIAFIDTSFLFQSISNSCSFYMTPKESGDYQVYVSNNYSKIVDSLNYHIELQEDQFPTIYVNEFVDSNYLDYKFFVGEIQDDYGFKKLSFNYYTKKNKIQESLDVKYQNSNRSSFSFDFDFSKLSLSEGEEITYYFTVWDNDGIIGPKQTKSQEFVLIKLNKEELKKERTAQRIAQENGLKNLHKNVSSFHEDLKNIKNSLLQKKKMDWEDKSNIEDFLQKKKQIALDLEKLQKNMKKSLAIDQNNKNEEITQKQELLNKMMDELMSDEMKKLYDELSDLINEMNKNNVLEKMEDIDLSQENLIKELDRTIEHFKRLEIEKKAEEISAELKELSKRQKDLAEKSLDKVVSSFNKNKEQEKIKDDFYDIKNEIYELKKKNEELESPKKLDTESDENEVKEEMEKSMESLSNNKNKKASESQKKASDKMNELADKLGALSKKDSEQQEEDMEALRLLLEQLVTFSIQQEELLASLKTTNPQDPKYVEIGQHQRKLKDEIRVVEDSLAALGKRQIMISGKINEEVQIINRSLNKSIKNLTERKKAEAGKNQQTVMMHTNELGLLLSEIIETMQQNMPGNGQCNKPGGNSKKPGNSLPKNAEQLKKQIDAMKKFMKGQKDGKAPGNKPGHFEQLGRMAGQQAAIKKELMKLSQELNKDGSGKGNGLKEIIKELEEIENQIINNELDLSSIMRQEEIKIKLLELEKATKEQEEDKKREAKESEDNFKRNNIELYKEYLKIKTGEIELLKSIPPNLKPYYKNKVNEYFKNIEKSL